MNRKKKVLDAKLLLKPGLTSQEIKTFQVHVVLTDERKREIIASAHQRLFKAKCRLKQSLFIYQGSLYFTSRGSIDSIALKKFNRIVFSLLDDYEFAIRLLLAKPSVNLWPRKEQQTISNFLLRFLSHLQNSRRMREYDINTLLQLLFRFHQQMDTFNISVEPLYVKSPPNRGEIKAFLKNQDDEVRTLEETQKLSNTLSEFEDRGWEPVKDSISGIEDYLHYQDETPFTTLKKNRRKAKNF